jgi:hypothetical protein
MGYSRLCFTFSITLYLKVGNFILFFKKVEKKALFSKEKQRSGNNNPFGGKEWETLPLNF